MLIWALLLLGGDIEKPSMHFLDSVLEHGPIHFLQEIAIDMDSIFRRYSEEILIIRRVMDLAQREPITDHRHAVSFTALRT